jgi:maltodextrin utilization protein YvdJ
VRINASPSTFIEKPGIEVNVFTARFRVKLLAVLTMDPNRVLVLIFMVLRAGVTTVVATLILDAFKAVVLAHPRISVFPPINTFEVVEIVSVKMRTVEIVLPVNVLAMYPTVL